MTVMDFPLTSTDALSALTVASVHALDAGHLDSRPDTARIPLELSVQLPAHYLVAALYGEWAMDDLETPEMVRSAVTTSLFCSPYAEIEDKAFQIANGEAADPEWVEALRVKVAEAFAPCDPWTLPRPRRRTSPAPVRVIR